MLRRENSLFLCFFRYQQEMAMTTIAATRKPLITLCENLLSVVEENTIDQKSTISFLPVIGLNSTPTGCCIQALAVSIQYADRFAPIAVSQVLSRWNPLLTLFQPKYMTAKKVLSIKNAKIPSMASGAPKMSPTNQE